MPWWSHQFVMAREQLRIGSFQSATNGFELPRLPFQLRIWETCDFLILQLEKNLITYEVPILKLLCLDMASAHLDGGADSRVWSSRDKPERLEGNLIHCHFVYHEWSHIKLLGIEPGPKPWETKIIHDMAKHRPPSPADFLLSLQRKEEVLPPHLYWPVPTLAVQSFGRKLSLTVLDSRDVCIAVAHVSNHCLSVVPLLLGAFSLLAASLFYIFHGSHLVKWYDTSWFNRQQNIYFKCCYLHWLYLIAVTYFRPCLWPSSRNLIKYVSWY
jgi:hypothetical protein